MELLPIKYSFKTVVVKDEAGNPVKDEKGEVKKVKDEPITVQLPQFTSATDVQEILAKNDEKEVKLILEALNQIIINQAKEVIDEDRDVARSNGVPVEKVDWSFIANLPPASRKGSGIPDETWDMFEKDYTEVIMHHGKTESQAKMGAKFLRRRFQPCKDNKKVIGSLQKNLYVWFQHSSNAEELTQVYETLLSKADELLAKDEDVMAAAV